MTPALPALLAGAAVLALAGAMRPVGPDRALALAPPAVDSPRRGHGPLEAIGRPVRRVLGRPPDPRADRRVGAAVLVGFGLVAVMPPMALVWGAGFGVASVVRRRRGRERAERAMFDELPEVVDLLSLAVSAGLTVPLALGVVADRGHGRLAAELGRARRAAELGTGLADAIDTIPARLGDEVRPITRLLSGSLRDGTSIADALSRVAGEVRTERRRRAEERARKVSVRLLFPLVCCVLPAFALLTVVPLLVGSLSSISF
ncbi:MAG: type II secretion system F family protein [Acidimicrobiales bacterium]|nr:type II secretion system F family protein [Acidimicrobiales bacterium]